MKWNGCGGKDYLLFLFSNFFLFFGIICGCDVCRAVKLPVRDDGRAFN